MAILNLRMEMNGFPSISPLEGMRRENLWVLLESKACGFFIGSGASF